MPTIKTVETVLTDKSIVYDVVLRDAESEQLFRFPCVSGADASRFSRLLKNLINEHTTLAEARVE
jgi:hypothetical protein